MGPDPSRSLVGKEELQEGAGSREAFPKGPMGMMFPTWGPAQKRYAF